MTNFVNSMLQLAQIVKPEERTLEENTAHVSLACCNDGQMVAA